MTQQWTVREARERRKPPITQEQLAEKTGFDQTYISLIERGLRIPQDPDTRKRLAKALGIRPAQLRFQEPRPDATVTPTRDRAGQRTPSDKDAERRTA